MKQIKRTAVCIMALAGILTALYVGLSVYYRNGFPFYTWINGIYCTGKSVVEVNEELKDMWEAPAIEIRDKEGKSYALSPAQIDYRADYGNGLNQYLAGQKSFGGIFQGRDYKLQPDLIFDEEKLKNYWDQLPFVVCEREKKSVYGIFCSEKEGYSLANELTDRVNIENAYEDLKVFLAQEGREGERLCFDLAERGYYYDIPLTKVQQETARLWDKIDRYQNAGVVYQFDDEDYALDAGDMADFLEKDGSTGLPVLDEEGNFVISRDRVKAFVKAFAERYDTYGKEWRFTTTSGKEIRVNSATYGMTINQEAEEKYLLSYLETLVGAEGEKIRGKDGGKETAVPHLKREAYYLSKNSLGDTYIEIDMGTQNMYYYKDGKQVVNTPVVTGNMLRKGTPEMVCYVYGKQRNRVLRGPGYASWVRYWVPVKGGIGIHDAGWRNEFGGEIYKTAGSHGCINTPDKAMETLYELVEIGTPVILFY